MNIQEKHKKNLILILVLIFSRNILSGLKTEKTPKRSPKRRGPAKKYAPETTDVTPVKKPRHKTIAKKGAKFTTQAATASTVVTAPEFPTPKASPLDEKDETSRIPAQFQSYSFRMMEEFERMKTDKERLIDQATNYLIERRFLINRIRELENSSESEVVDQILTLAQNFKSKRRGSKIVQDAMMAAEVSEPEMQTHPTYPSRQPENLVYYSQPQNFHQIPEPYRGIKDVLISASNGIQKRATVPVSNLSSYQVQNQTHQNF